jgi:hypothetical protein
MGWAPVGPTRSKREEAEEPASQSRPKADLIRRGPTTLEPAMTALRANPTPSIPPTDSFEEPVFFDFASIYSNASVTGGVKAGPALWCGHLACILIHLEQAGRLHHKTAPP